MLFRLLPVPLCVMKVFMHVTVCKTLKVHPVASKTLTQKIPPQNASLEIRHCPFDYFEKWTNPEELCPHPTALAAPSASLTFTVGSSGSVHNRSSHVNAKDLFPEMCGEI